MSTDRTVLHHTREVTYFPTFGLTRRTSLALAWRKLNAPSEIAGILEEAKKFEASKSSKWIGGVSVKDTEAPSVVGMKDTDSHGFPGYISPRVYPAAVCSDVRIGPQPGSLARILLECADSDDIGMSTF